MGDRTPYDPCRWECERRPSNAAREATCPSGKPAKNRSHWFDTLAHLNRAFGEFLVDELTHAHIVTWRAKVGRWIREGMPSSRARDAGKGKIVKLSPATANGWIAILKVICKAMTRHFDLPRDPAAEIQAFALPRTYTREEPNALTAPQTAMFLAKMKELYPQHYAMTLLGFVIGARPSTLRPLRRSGPTPDVLWDERLALLTSCASEAPTPRIPTNGDSASTTAPAPNQSSTAKPPEFTLAEIPADKLGSAPAGFGLKVGDKAPDASLPDISGKMHCLADLYATAGAPHDAGAKMRELYLDAMARIDELARAGEHVRVLPEQ